MEPAQALAEPAELAARPASRSLYRFALVVVAATLILVKVGAMVTSTGSGLAFADWPLSDGSWWPPNMTGARLLEHGHRAVGLTIGLLVLALTIWTFLAERRRWVAELAYLAGALVVVQAVVGGMGVRLGLPAVTSVVHGVLAQVIVCVLALVAFALSPAWRVRVTVPAGQARSARRLALAGLLLVFCQLLAGAILRHTNAQGMLWLHIVNALVVALAILCTALYAGTRFPAAGFAGLGRIVLGLLAAQLVLGFVTLAVRRVKDPSNVEYLGRSLVATTHVVVGAVLFLSAAVLTYKAFRNLAPDGGNR